jgi:protein-disulfide isomerase/uncharacterized membrane protein
MTRTFESKGNARMEPKSQTRQNLWKSALIIAILGLITSIYSLNHHMELKRAGHTEASCNINSTISCDLVAASKYSEVFGIPLAVWGFGYFAAMAIFAATILRGHKSAKEHEPAWFFMAGAGVLSSLGLATISLGILKAVCLVCVVIYALNAAQAVVAYLLWKPARDKFAMDLKSTTGGLTTAAIAVAVSILAFNYIKPSPLTPTESLEPAKNSGQLPQFSSQQVDIPINKTPYSGLGEDFRKGPDDAKIVIVEFADYMCPACGQAAPVLEELHKQLGNRALLVFKNYPLSNQCNSSVQSDMHPHSCDIAKLARCAGSNGKFWDYHLRAMEQQSTASKEKARAWGKAVGLTDQQMDQCLASNDILAKIRDDVDLGNKLGVNSTPTIFINGKKYLGERSTQAMRAVIESM